MQQPMNNPLRPRRDDRFQPRPPATEPARRQPKDRPPTKKNGFPSLLLAICALTLALFGLRYWTQHNARLSWQQKLITLQSERLAAKQKHEEELNYYQGLKKKSNTQTIIDKYAKEYRVDPSFVSAIIARESHYDPYAVSRVGARGLMQIMEETGKWIAGRLKVNDYTYDHLFDPDINIRFGTWYLSYLSDIFQGNPEMVAAAYHAGANNVQHWALKFAPDRRTLSYQQFPKDDTKDYVGKVMKAYALYHEYAQTNP